MRICNFSYTGKGFAALFLFCLLSSLPVGAQTPTTPRPTGRSGKPIPTLISPEERAPAPVARETDMQCSGFIEHAPPAARFEIIGSEQEQAKRLYGEGDSLFINAGAQQEVKVGQEFAVVRPRGQFTSAWTQKKGTLGVYTQEVGRVRVTAVKPAFSVARIIRTCDNILLGDLLRTPSEEAAPTSRAEDVPLENFVDTTGKQTGRIVMARDMREMISRDQVIFIDLGQEDKIKTGDYMTIYRPLGTGGITKYRDDDISQGAVRGFESDRYHGGKFSIKSTRAEKPQGGTFSGTRDTATLREKRTAVARQVLGEAVVLKVEGRTATAIITRVTQEVHTGDFVEVQ